MSTHPNQSTPEGYSAAAMSGDNITQLDCDDCGASVTPSAAGRHTSWHESVITDKKLADVFNQMTDRGRYNR
jgi:hypothetical protein